MATSKFAREPKMFTTEPSADEVGKGMKRGGRASKKHMLNGGVMGAAAPMATPTVPRRRPPMVPPTAMPSAPRNPMMRKNGGEVESPAEHKAEMREMRKLGKELKHHEGMRASKAHKGLKAGGSPAPKAGPSEIGGLAGGLEATRPNPKKDTGGVRAPGYKSGGGAEAAERFETKTTLKPKIDVNDKVVEATSHKGGKKTGNLEGKGYKHGGKLKKFASGGIATKGMAVARKYETTINDASAPHKASGKTGSIEGSQYKHGGHVMHHKSQSKHADGGHVHMHQHAAKHAHGHTHHSEHSMKKGGSASHKMSKGGKCNY